MKHSPLFVFFLAIYPGLMLLAWNDREVEPSVVVRPLIFSILVMAAFVSASLILIRDRHKAYLIAAAVLLFFFSLGHMLILLEGSRLAVAIGVPARSFQLFASLALLAGLVGLFRAILKTKRDLAGLYPPLNAISLFLIISTLVPLIGRSFAHQDGFPPSPKVARAPQASDPDVYYIVLDAYGRRDSLQALGYDNSPFLQELTDLGFYIASCSRSNYPQTVMSMASSLNMDYLWQAIPNQGANDRNADPVYQGILQSQVRRAFEGRGYRILVFDSGIPWLTWPSVDAFLTPPQDTIFSMRLDPFEYLFLDTTALHPLMTASAFLRQKYLHHFDRIHFVLDELPRIAASPGPKFVYVHMLIPHRPNIFLPDGSMNLNADFYRKGVGEGIDRQHDIAGYLNNMKFINSRLPGVLREVIRNSHTPPIIVIQGDHGYQLPDIRFDILNAYHFPGQKYADLYPQISPVNTFRVIFNTYFKESYPLLEDQSINVGINRPYGKKSLRPGPCL